MIRAIDSALNRITMYRLVMYGLFFLLIVAALLGAIGVTPYSPFAIAGSAIFIFGACYAMNTIFAAAFDAPSNPESVWITALILALIIAPPTAIFDTHFLALAFWASAWAMVSKYILAIRKKHIFNPAAFGVAVTSLTLGLSASWWVGTIALAPFVLVVGLLVVRKIRHFDLWWAFILTFFIGQTLYALLGGHVLGTVLAQSFLYAPAFFFSTIMLTEPLTTPPTRPLRIIYGVVVGVLFLPNIHLSIIYLTPELALLIGNLFAYLVSPKAKLILTLQEVRRLSHNVYEFIFESGRRLAFAPGQYMEWMLPHDRADARGQRRYFTIASAPSERGLRLGVKFYEPSSTYKQTLLGMQPGETIVASQLSGDFTLPRDPRTPLVFIAGGIGSTPFRSMIRHMLDTKEQHPVILIYQNNAPEDTVYHEIFEQAERELGLRYENIYAPLDAGTVRRLVPDYTERTFYLSGPQAMVTSYKSLLRRLGVSRRRIKTDYFPGF